MSATVVNPADDSDGSAVSQDSSRVQGSEKTAPMATLIERRYSGSAQRGDSRTASKPRAAPERKIAPTLVWSTMSSSTSTDRAPARTESTEGSGSRASEASAPRWTWKPVTCSASASETT